MRRSAAYSAHSAGRLEWKHYVKGKGEIALGGYNEDALGDAIANALGDYDFQASDATDG